MQQSMAAKGVLLDNINSAITAMRISYSYAEGHDLIEYNPFYGVKPYCVMTRIPEILTRLELRKTIAVMEAMANDSL
jgi:site-specific recombinase XerD